MVTTPSSTEVSYAYMIATNDTSLFLVLDQILQPEIFSFFLLYFCNEINVDTMLDVVTVFLNLYVYLMLLCMITSLAGGR